MTSLEKQHAAAIRTFEMWHQKPYSGTERGPTYNLPEEVECVGRMVEILYWSDKWETDGKYYEYIHTFDSAPKVYANLAGVGAAKSTAQLLGLASVHGQIPVPVLATVLHLVYSDGKRNTTLRFRSPPVMSCSADKKTLAVFPPPSKGGPFLVRGGKMQVTKRGIVW